ncbi:MAG: pyridoxal-phosphate dependent enzyme [Chloroflexi bacterium]|nr:pyridoxal-phosphate dependent enzyme [Chloroflexota bacterium]
MYPVTLEDITAARRRGGSELRTPLRRYCGEESPAEIYLKMENLQAVGSFKLRGAVNALAQLDQMDITRGVWTASAGNMGYALAWAARRSGTPCAVIVPEDAPQAKIQAMVGQAAQINPVPFTVYQEIQNRRDWRGFITPDAPGALSGRLVHPFSDAAVMAGNGVIGLEILEDLPDVEAVVIPYGGGGLSCGIASALGQSGWKGKIYACETANAAPLAASLATGKPVEVRYTPSFISGMGAPFVFAEMWPYAQALLDDSLVVSREEVRRAMAMLALRNKVIAEGAGAVSLAAALGRRIGRGKVVCIVSGGNAEPSLLAEILMETAL